MYRITDDEIRNWNIFTRWFKEYWSKKKAINEDRKRLIDEIYFDFCKDNPDAGLSLLADFRIFLEDNITDRWIAIEKHRKAIEEKMLDGFRKAWWIELGRVASSTGKAMDHAEKNDKNTFESGLLSLGRSLRKR